ncbi:MAG: hypothetical protein ACREHF_11515 [Rhizomicrobium sp.]
MSDPVIVLAGRAWRVPWLAPRQNRIVIPAILELGATPDYARLMDIALAALTRAHPALDRAAFEEQPIPLCELIDALPVIARQTGFVEMRAHHIGPAKVAPPDFDALIAEFVNFLPGTTPDYWEDALTAHRLAAMRAEWRKHPPLALLAAAWLGYRPRPRDDDALSELMRLFPNGKLRLN